MTGRGKYFLAGDIGGTKTLLGIFSVQGGAITFAEKKKFPSRDFLSLTDIIDAFLSEVDLDVGRETTCFGIAGPCEGGVCRTRNLPWVVDREKIRDRFGFAGVSLINDFEAIVHGIPHLSGTDLMVLNPGVKDPQGNIAVLGAGTGLGEAFAVYAEPIRGYRVYPSEGGHASFAPTNEEEIALLQYLRGEYDHVSFERVLSGSGLVKIYEFLLSTGDYEVSEQLRQEMESILDPAAAITRFGLDGQSEICSRALDIFCSVYGSETGNLALKVLPAGGIYLAGGIAAKIRKRLRQGFFLQAFLNKGRSKGLLQNIPVSVVLNPEVGLIGAAARALA